MTQEETIQNNLNSLNIFFNKNEFKKNECIILEKNENSFLVPFAKESTKEFFEKIFSEQGPFWEAYFELGLGEIPKGKEYTLFINNELYFCKNIENQYIYSIGPKPLFEYKNKKLIQIKPISTDFTIRLLSAPFDIISQTKQIVIDAFLINEILPEIKIQLEESKNYWETNKDKLDFELFEAEYALEKAVKCMKYSFLMSLAYLIKLKPSEQIVELINETKKIYDSIKNIKNEEDKLIDTSYFGKNIYDISQTRVFDNTNLINEFESLKLPIDKWMILRETLKIICARYLAVQRKAYLSIGRKFNLGENIFYLSTKEISEIKENKLKEILKLTNERKLNFEINSKNNLPNKLIYLNKWFFEEKINLNALEEIIGVSVGAKTNIKGIATFVKNDSDLKKDFSGKIIITNYFSPNLVVTYKSALGIISSVGGELSHPAIVAREKNIPCIIQANINTIHEGDEIELNGERGIAKIIKKN